MVEVLSKLSFDPPFRSRDKSFGPGLGLFSLKKNRSWANIRSTDRYSRPHEIFLPKSKRDDMIGMYIRCSRRAGAFFCYGYKGRDLMLSLFFFFLSWLPFAANTALRVEFFCFLHYRDPSFPPTSGSVYNSLVPQSSYQAVNYQVQSQLSAQIQALDSCPRCESEIRYMASSLVWWSGGNFLVGLLWDKQSTRPRRVLDELGLGAVGKNWLDLLARYGQEVYYCSWRFMKCCSPVR